MPRLLLGVSTSSGHAGLNSRATVSPASAQNNLLSPSAIEARLRQPRSTAYREAVACLDSGGHTHDPLQLEQLLATLAQEFPEFVIEQYPLGIVAKCYLGAPFEVHTLDRANSIIQHYKRHESLPGGLESARSLALHPAYLCVEVYSDKLIAVSKSGAVAVIESPPTT